MIVPIRMLWNMQIKLRQKLAIGTTLCLSVMMIISAIVQISTIRTSTNAVDITWATFWQLVEATVAVVMVSLTALRSFFVARSSRVRQSPNHSSGNWSARQAKRWLKIFKKPTREYATKGSDETENMQRWSQRPQLPEIPRATLTGIRSLIRGERHLVSRTSNIMGSVYENDEMAEDPWRLSPLWKARGDRSQQERFEYC